MLLAIPTQPPRSACKPMCNVVSISKVASGKDSNPAPSPTKRRRTWSADRRVWAAQKREREPMVTSEPENKPASRRRKTNKVRKSSRRNTTIVCTDCGAQVARSDEKSVEKREEDALFQAI